MLPQQESAMKSEFLEEGDFRGAVEHFRAQRRAQAASICRRLLDRNPDDHEALHMLGVILCEQGNAAEGLPLLERAAALDPGHPGKLHSFGRMLARNGRQRDAITHFLSALAIVPHDARIHRNLGRVYLDLGMWEAALECFDRSQALDPNNAALHNDRGIALSFLGRVDEAVAAYQRAIDLDPSHREAWGNLATMYERSNRLPEATATIEEGLRRIPQSPELNVRKAILERRAGDTAAARARLLTIDRSQAAIGCCIEIEFELARLADIDGETEAAVSHCSNAHALRRKRRAALETVEKPYGDYLEVVRQGCTPAFLSELAARSVPVAGEEPIIITGFPRSGTTLLDTILDSHPRFQVLEEKPVLTEVMATLSNTALDLPEILLRLDERQLGELRRRYFDAARRYLERQPDTFLVDKNPFYTAYLPLLYRLFPKAKIIFVVRHPCDVCLSCFMYNFIITSGMGGYSTLREFAEVYAKAMDAWCLFKRALPLQFHEVRYEDLVADQEGTLTKLFGFLGVEWHESVLDHARHAREHRKTLIPNCDAVTKSIYESAKYRWLRYEKYCEEMMPVLRPYIEYFGYSDVG